MKNQVTHSTVFTHGLIPGHLEGNTIVQIYVAYAESKIFSETFETMYLEKKLKAHQTVIQEAALHQVKPLVRLAQYTHCLLL